LNAQPIKDFFHALKFRCAFVAGHDHNSAPYNIREPSWGFNLVNLLTNKRGAFRTYFLVILSHAAAA
jgi:hypothetical protein